MKQRQIMKNKYLILAVIVSILASCHIESEKSSNNVVDTMKAGNIKAKKDLTSLSDTIMPILEFLGERKELVNMKNQNVVKTDSFLSEYLGKNIHHPLLCDCQFRFLLSYMVDKNGKAADIKIIRSNTESDVWIDSLVIDALKRTLFSPAKYKDEKINVNITSCVSIRW